MATGDLSQLLTNLFQSARETFLLVVTWCFRNQLLVDSSEPYNIQYIASKNGLNSSAVCKIRNKPIYLLDIGEELTTLDCGSTRRWMIVAFFEDLPD